MVQNSSRNRLAIVSAVTDEGLKMGDDLGKQIRHGRGIAYFRRGEFAGENLIKGITGSNLLLQEDCEFGRGGCSPVQILLTQGAVQAD